MTPEQQAEHDKQEAARNDQKTREAAEATAKSQSDERAKLATDQAQHEQPKGSAKTQDDFKAEASRSDSVVVNNPKAPEAVAEQHRKVDEFNEKRSADNEEGHKRNMERIENAAQEAQARTQHADDHRANHTPTGKEVNNNTPRVLPDGTKVWDYAPVS